LKNWIDKHPSIWMWLAGAFAGLIYWICCPTTVTFGDSGDFITAAWCGWFPHPPGYPAYTIIARLFALLPLPGEVAWKVNLSSVLFMACTVGLMVRFSIRLIGHLFPEAKDNDLGRFLIGLTSLGGALVFAFHNATWSQAIIAEVHALNAFLLIVMLNLILEYFQNQDDRLWWAGSLIWGFSLGVHQSGVLYLLPLALALWLSGHWRNVTKPRVMITSVALVLLGFTVHLWLPLVSLRLPVVEWGYANYWKGFKDILLRADYAPFVWSRSGNVLFNQISTAVWMWLFGQANTIGAILSGMAGGLFFIAGGLMVMKRDRVVGSLLIGMALLVAAFFIASNNHSMARQLSLETRDVFFIPAYLIYGLCWSVGIFSIVYLIAENYQEQSPAINTVGYIVVLFLVLISCLVQFPRHYEKNNRLASEFGQFILDTMEKDALYVGDDDLHLFPVWYQQQVLGYRKDVQVCSRTSFYKHYYYLGLRNRNIKLPAYNSKDVPRHDPKAGDVYLNKQMFSLLKMNLDRHPAYFYQKYSFVPDTTVSLFLQGILYRVTTTQVFGQVSTSEGKYLSPANSVTIPEIDPLQQDQWDFWQSWAVKRYADYYRREAQRKVYEARYDEAESMFKQAIMWDTLNSQNYADLGRFYLQQNKMAPAFECFKLARQYEKK